MGRAFILVLQHKDINSSQSVERLKVKTTSLLEKAMGLSVYEFMVLLLHRLVGECELASWPIKKEVSERMISII